MAHDNHDAPSTPPHETPFAAAMRRIRHALPAEILVACAIAIAAFAHYDARVEAHEAAIAEIKRQETDRDSQYRATRAELKRDQDGIHSELKDDWKSLEKRLDKIDGDAQEIKMTQLRICLANKIKCN